MEKDETKRKEGQERILMLTMAVLIGFLGGFLVSNKSNKIESIAPGNMDYFLENYNYIKDTYYEDIDDRELMQGAIKGMLESLGDPYSTFLHAESNTFTILLEGEYEGLGIQIAQALTGEIYIIEVYKNTPAEKIGLKAGDQILKIDDEEVTKEGYKSSEVTKYIASKTKNDFIIEVKRTEEILKFELKKEAIILESVQSKKIDDKIGYIKVDVFANNTYSQFKSQLNTLEKDGIESLIIDLRDNTGGHLHAVQNMTSLFLDNTHLMYQTETKEIIEKKYSFGKETKKYKIIVLTNKNTASASEMLTAALKEEQGALQIGETTYGKGLIQELRGTTSATDAYKITAKKWLTPKGNWINEIGLIPDIEEALTEEFYLDPTEEKDNQLQKAISELRKQ